MEGDVTRGKGLLSECGGAVLISNDIHECSSFVVRSSYFSLFSFDSLSNRCGVQMVLVDIFILSEVLSFCGSCIAVCFHLVVT